MTTTQNSGANSPELSWDRVYGDPENTGKKLISKQGTELHKGTCGIVSCANVLRLAGQTSITENDVRRSAQQRNLCTAYHVNDFATDDQKNKLILENGATTPIQRLNILKEYGIESTLECGRRSKSICCGNPTVTCNRKSTEKCCKDPTSMQPSVIAIAEYVIAGYGVIVSVYSNILWEKAWPGSSLHAVTVIGVKKDAANQRLLGFYICDSGRKGTVKNKEGKELDCYDMDHAHYYDVQSFSAAFSCKPMNVTKYPIRLEGGNP